MEFYPPPKKKKKTKKKKEHIFLDCNSFPNTLFILSWTALVAHLWCPQYAQKVTSVSNYDFPSLELLYFAPSGYNRQYRQLQMLAYSTQFSMYMPQHMVLNSLYIFDTVKSVLRDHYYARPPVLIDHTFIANKAVFHNSSVVHDKTKATSNNHKGWSFEMLYSWLPYTCIWIDMVPTI